MATERAAILRRQIRSERSLWRPLRISRVAVSFDEMRMTNPSVLPFFIMNYIAMTATDRWSAGGGSIFSHLDEYTRFHGKLGTIAVASTLTSSAVKYVLDCLCAMAQRYQAWCSSIFVAHRVAVFGVKVTVRRSGIGTGDKHATKAGMSCAISRSSAC